MPFITADNAAELGRRSGQSRREHGTRRKPQQPANIPEHIDPYSKQTLLRVRKQVRSVLGMLETEIDPQKIDRLASALARLNEVERQLANRPLPGSWKPERPARAKQAWIDPTPAPMPQPVVPQQTHIDPAGPAAG